MPYVPVSAASSCSSAEAWSAKAEQKASGLTQDLIKAEKKTSGLTRDLIKAEQKTRLQPMSNSMRR
jgi:hypothetical protein